MTDHSKTKEIAPHIYYEYQMMKEAAKKLKNKDYNDEFEEYELLEVFLLHIRNLKEFFSVTSTHNDAVFAIHFFNNEEWKLDIKQACKYLHKKQNNLHSDLAHISYNRLKTQDIHYKNFGWDIEKIEDELSKVWEKFINSLNDEMKKWFTEKSSSSNTQSVSSSSVLQFSTNR